MDYLASLFRFLLALSVSPIGTSVLVVAATLYLRRKIMKALAALAALETAIGTFAAKITDDNSAIQKKLDDAANALQAAIDGADLSDADATAFQAAQNALTAAAASSDALAATAATPPTAPAVTVPTPEAESVPVTDQPVAGN